MAAPSRQEIFKKVQQALVDALSVEEDEVREDATLTGDLQAESIDILDIVFRLEKTFNIKISQEELTPRDILSNPADDGTLNECDAVSMAFGFTAAGATFADPPADGGGLSPKVCLGAYSATCP